MNQQAAVLGQKCPRSQNGRGGLFYVIDDAVLADSLGDLIKAGQRQQGLHGRTIRPLDSKIAP